MAVGRAGAARLKIESTPLPKGRSPQSQRGRGESMSLGANAEGRLGVKELACGGQAFIATSLFDPSMSALLIIVKQNSQSVGLFTR
jgi:hypothetical protein